tara:strand:- start:14961 stop:15509 length:549 start_codon:yes stop_codon:yes gene_type:complete
MADSLQDQLLKSGLADADKAKRLAKEKRKAAKLARGTGIDLIDENKEAVRQVLAKKVQRDRELNQALNSKALRKAINAQIKQLIENHKLESGQGEIGFNFSDGKKVKKLYVTSLEQKQLSAGVLSIVKQGDEYKIVPRKVADKISERDPDRVIASVTNPNVALTQEEQDWYKDYEVPDDLNW